MAEPGLISKLVDKVEDAAWDGITGPLLGPLTAKLSAGATSVLQHYLAPHAPLRRHLPLAVAIRRAQLDALERVRHAHARALQALPATSPGKYVDEWAFNAALQGYIGERRVLFSDAAVDVHALDDRDVADLLRWAIYQVQPGASAAAQRESSEEQMLQELEQQLSIPIPGHFKASFGAWHEAWIQMFQERLSKDADLAHQMHEAQIANVLVQGDQLKDLVLQVLTRLPPATTASYTLSRPFNFTQLIEDKTRYFHGRRRLLAEISAWIADDAARERVLLIQAHYGVGKTSLMAELCRQRLARHATATAVHFCRWDHERTLEPGHIVRSLAAQFARNLPGYAAMLAREAGLRDLLDEQAALQRPAQAWQSGVLGPLRELAGADAPRPGEVHVLLVDGLDESSERTQAGESLLSLIGKAAQGGQLPPWLRVILASRPDERLVAARPDFWVVDLLQAQEREQLADLRGFVAARCEALALPGGPLAPPVLDALGLSGEQLVEALCVLSDGRFLVAAQAFAFIGSRDFSARALAQLLEQARLAPGIESFLAWSFSERVRKQGLDVPLTRDVLGVVAAARDPLTSKALAAVLRGEGPGGPDADAVRKVLQSLGGLVYERAPQVGQGLPGWTFAHKSIEDWLDPGSPLNRPEGRRPAGDYAIDRPQSLRRIEALCTRVELSKTPREAAGDFWPYLERWGVGHLLDGEPMQLAAAVSLLARRLDALAAPRRPDGAYRMQEALVLEQLRLRFRSLDERPRPPMPHDPELAGLDSADLQALLHARAYETGKYQPLIRAIAQYHPADWEALRDHLLTDDNDLVLRNDIGVAMARAWHAQPGPQGEALLAQIVALSSHAVQGSPQREIAGYAVKHICQRIEPEPWWQPKAVRERIAPVLARYAASGSATDRMVAGEAMLALAVQGEDVRRWAPAELAAFWQPRWPNQRADIDAIHACLAPAVGAAPSAATPGQVSLATQQALASELGVALQKDALFRPGAPLDKYPNLQLTLWPMANQQCGKDYIGDAVGDLLALGEQPEGLAFDAVRVLMLNPLWDVGEAGANLLADLIRRSEGRCMPWVDRLMQSDAAHWRLRYGAVDAAFTAGAVDGYAKFREVVVPAGMSEPACDPYGRVRGICADDLFAYLKGQDGLQRRQLLAPGQPLARLMQHWLAKADDIWLLEYLHALMRLLATGRHQVPETVHELMAGPLTKLLPTDAGEPFYRLELQDFLTRIEASRI